MWWALIAALALLALWHEVRLRKLTRAVADRDAIIGRLMVLADKRVEPFGADKPHQAM